MYEHVILYDNFNIVKTIQLMTVLLPLSIWIAIEYLNYKILALRFVNFLIDSYWKKHYNLDIFIRLEKSVIKQIFDNFEI